MTAFQARDPYSQACEWEGKDHRSSGSKPLKPRPARTPKPGPPRCARPRPRLEAAAGQALAEGRQPHVELLARVCRCRAVHVAGGGGGGGGRIGHLVCGCGQVGGQEGVEFTAECAGQCRAGQCEQDRTALVLFDSSGPACCKTQDAAVPPLGPTRGSLCNVDRLQIDAQRLSHHLQERVRQQAGSKLFAQPHRAPGAC